MKFRTEIEIDRCLPDSCINHDDKIVMIGSCFTDNIGCELQADGFAVIHNPMGPLYNPLSINTCLNRAAGGREYSISDFVRDPRGVYHCLDFASRYQSHDGEKLLQIVNSDLANLSKVCHEATIAIITLGSSYSFLYEPLNIDVGNCHKFPASDFSTHLLEFSQSVSALAGIANCFSNARKVIFTVSPVRHVAHGLHGNNISKAHLLLAVEEVIKTDSRNDYFPAYEIVNDDLRDYRFYAQDLKHPSEAAVQYVYEKFSYRYFSPATLSHAQKCRKEAKFAAHRPLLHELE